MKKPPSVTALAVLVLIFSVVSYAGTFEAVRLFDLLKELFSTRTAFLLVTSKLFWGTLGLTLFWSLWKGIFWAPRVMKIATIIYISFNWIQRIFMFTNGKEYNDWGKSIISGTVVILFTFWTLSQMTTKLFFKSRNL